MAGGRGEREEPAWEIGLRKRGSRGTYKIMQESSMHTWEY